MKQGMKDVLVLCDSEEEYAGLMTDFIKKHRGLPWDIHTYTEVEALFREEKNQEIAILLVSETVYSDEMKQLNPHKLVILNESGMVKEEGVENIDKYQQAEHVLRILLEMYADTVGGTLPCLAKGCKSKMIGVYSPIRRCYQTTFALTMSQLLAKEKRTLYLSFEHFVGISELIPDKQTKDMADLLYFLHTEKEKFRFRVHSIVRKKANLDYVPPMKSGQNLLGVTVNEWIKLLQSLAEMEEYDYIVLDLSESMQGLFEILRCCTVVYTLVSEDGIAQCKLMQYEHLLELYEYEDVLHKTYRCCLPKINKIPAEIEQYTRGELAKYVQKHLGELEK